jgi:hypothetical protein
MVARRRVDMRGEVRKCRFAFPDLGKNRGVE